MSLKPKPKEGPNRFGSVLSGRLCPGVVFGSVFTVV